MKAILKACLGLAALLATTGSMAQERAKPKDLGVLPTVITVSMIDPNGKVPVVNGVPGSGIDNLDMGFPQALMLHGHAYIFLFGSQNTTYSGKCTWSYKLTQGSTTLDSGTLQKNHTCVPGDYYAWDVVGKVIPNSPGLATLTGTVTFGGKKATMSITVRIV